MDSAFLGSCRSGQLVRSVQEGSTASLSLLKYSCFSGVQGYGFSAGRFHAAHTFGSVEVMDWAAILWPPRASNTVSVYRMSVLLLGL